MKTTSISIWYRRRVSGVRTALRSMSGTGEGLPGYELLSGTCVVQRGASGVQTALRNVSGTGDGPLGYEPHSGTCLVQERGFWGTNYSPKRVRYRRWASGVRTTLRNMCGTGEEPLMYGMPQNTLGTGKWVLVYRINEKRIPVQGLNFIRLTITILTEIFDNYEELQ